MILTVLLSTLIHQIMRVPVLAPNEHQPCNFYTTKFVDSDDDRIINLVRSESTHIVR